MGECNPACQKIIINSGLMAVAAGLLADNTPAAHPLRGDARRLQEVATAASQAYALLRETKALVPSGEPDWNGCDQAKALMTWVLKVEEKDADYSSPTPMTKAANELMKTWRAQILRELNDLVSGG